MTDGDTSLEVKKTMRPLWPIAIGVFLAAAFVPAWLDRAVPEPHTVASASEQPPVEEELVELLDTGTERVVDEKVEVQPEEPSEQTIRLHDNSMRIAQQARYFVDHRPVGYRADCSGYISGVLTESGIPASGTVATYWKRATRDGITHFHPIPAIGDLAFFNNTHDRNKNNKLDDEMTHIGVVVDVEPDGTIVLAHHGSKRTLIRMNLLQPLDHKDADGKVINSWLRRRGGRDDALTFHLTGALWSGFARVDESTDWDTLGRR